jgi:hypothetical protein
MDYSVTVFVDEFSHFSKFLIILLVFVHPESSSSSTDTRLAWKRECHSKTAVEPKEYSSKASLSISRVSLADFAGFHAKLDADTSLDFAIHCRQNEISCKNNECLQRCMM